MAEDGIPNVGGRLLGADHVAQSMDALKRSVDTLITKLGTGASSALSGGLNNPILAMSQAFRGGKWSAMTGGGMSGGLVNGGGATGLPVSSGGVGGGQPPGGPGSPPTTQGGGASNNGGRMGKLIGGAAVAGAVASYAPQAGSLLGTMARPFRATPDQQQVYRDMLYPLQQYDYASGRPRGGGSDYGYGVMSTFGGAQATAQVYNQAGRLGYYGASGRQQFAQSVGAVKMGDPGMSTSTATSATAGFQSMQGFQSLRRVGIQTYGSNGTKKTPMQIAQQVIMQLGLNNKKWAPKDIAFIVHDPRSGLNQTLVNWAANGIISSGQYEAIQSAVGQLLLAQSHGMSASGLESLQNKAQSSNTYTAWAAKNQLQKMGIQDSQAQDDLNKKGSEDYSLSKKLKGFSYGLENSTKTVTQFNVAMQQMLSMVPGLQFGLGAMKGQTSNGKVGTFGNFMSPGSIISNLIPGMAGGLGMAGGGVVPGVSGAGRDNQMYINPRTGHVLNLGGGEAIMTEKWTRMKGGPNAVKAENDRASSFAAGGVFAHPDKKVFMDGKAISAIAAAQIRLAEKIGGINLHIMQGGFGGDHIAASKTSHNYPGVADISPGTIAVETLLRRVGFAAWARNIPGRVQVGSGAHVHAISLLDPGDKSSPQVYGSWPAHKDGNTGGPGSDPAKHVPWLKGLKQKLGAMNLHGLGGGGGSGGGGGGGLGGILGGIGNAIGGALNGASDPIYTPGSGGVSSLGGAGYSELASMVAGMSATVTSGFWSPGDTNGSSGSSGGGSGGGGGIGGSIGGGNPGNIRIGGYNFKHGTAFTQHGPGDVQRIMGKVDVFGTSEMRTAHGKLASYLHNQGWGYMQGPNSDTGIAYDASKYDVVRKGSFPIEGTLWNGKKMRNSVPYMLLRDKKTGAKFWVMSAHTQVHGYKGGPQGAVMHKQYAQIRAWFNKLKATGAPVFLVGDLNNPHPMKSGIAPPSAHAYGQGIDWIIASKGKNLGVGELPGTGFHGANHANAVMHSDHPFVYGGFDIPGFGPVTGGGGSGGGGGGGSPAQNKALGKQLASHYGWGSGAQWDALVKLWDHESGWRTNADNPHSSAYGIPQALVASYGREGPLHQMGYWAHKTGSGAGSHYTGGDPAAQIRWGLNYIKGRYHTPVGAWGYWQGHNSYAKGAWSIMQDEVAQVHKGEMILPTQEAETIRQVLTRNGRGAAGINGAVGGAGIIFQPNSIHITVGPGVSPQTGRAIGKAFVDELAQDRRIKALMAGDLHA